MFQISYLQRMSSRFWSYAPPAAGITNSTADVAVKAAVVGERNYVASLQVAVSVVLANVTTLVVKSNTTVLARIPVNTAVGPMPPVNFDPPLRGGVNEAINIAAETIFATGNLLVNAQGYQA